MSLWPHKLLVNQYSQGNVWFEIVNCYSEKRAFAQQQNILT